MGSYGLGPVNPTQAGAAQIVSTGPAPQYCPAPEWRSGRQAGIIRRGDPALPGANLNPNP